MSSRRPVEAAPSRLQNIGTPQLTIDQPSEGIRAIVADEKRD